MYPDKYKTTLALIEEMRENNISFDFLGMSEDEKEKLVKSFHPEYKNDGFVSLRVGTNKNEKVPFELAELLESQSNITETRIDLSLPDFDVDVLVIGGGGAGAAAAIEVGNVKVCEVIARPLPDVMRFLTTGKNNKFKTVLS